MRARLWRAAQQQRDQGRLLRVVVRVGDYKQDSFIGTGEGTIDLVPRDDDIFAIRHRIWLATDRAYKVGERGADCQAGGAEAVESR